MKFVKKQAPSVKSARVCQRALGLTLYTLNIRPSDFSGCRLVGESLRLTPEGVATRRAGDWICPGNYDGYSAPPRQRVIGRCKSPYP